MVESSPKPGTTEPDPTPVDPAAFGIVPASSERGGPKDMWAVTYRGVTLSRWDRFGDARADMLDRAGRALQERSTAPVSGVTEEMTERAAQVIFDRSARALAWDDDRTYWMIKARAALEAALSGRIVIDPPSPDSAHQYDDPTFTIGALVRSSTGEPRVHMDAAESDTDDETCVSWHADVAERVGVALVAAAREARRLATESGDQHD